MTNKEYISSTLGLYGITDDVIEVILLDANLNGSDYCDVSACKHAMFRDFHFIRTAAHRNVSEGGFSMSWTDCETALKDFQKQLADEVGDDGNLNGAGCRDRSNLW